VSIEEIMAQSPTPRTHSIWNALVNAGSNPVETGRILGAARKMELELKAANDRIKRLEDCAETAWGIIANVSGGNWAEQRVDWREAAIRWRDKRFKPEFAERKAKEAKP
jgi:hypothetical protein